MIKNIAFLLFLFFQLTACVQKTSRKTVVYMLNVADTNNVKTVGMRGRDKPLNWQTDFELKRDGPDSSYKAVVSYVTGYKFTEVKFVVNNQFELQDPENRRVVFADSDTTIYTATFDVKK